MPAARLFALALALSACSAVPDTFLCAHCACGPASRAISRPMLCSSMGRDAACCMVFPGS